jgi:hypothetical protein
MSALAAAFAESGRGGPMPTRQQLGGSDRCAFGRPNRRVSSLTWAPDHDRRPNRQLTRQRAAPISGRDSVARPLAKGI